MNPLDEEQNKYLYDSCLLTYLIGATIAALLACIMILA